MCRIGQPSHCNMRVCEFSKHFNLHCYGEKIKSAKLPTYEDLVMQHQESEKNWINNQNKGVVHLFKKIPPKKQKKRIVVAESKRLVVFNKTNGTCYLCGNNIKQGKMTIDHVIPLSRGGTNDIENLMPSCGKCNGEKGNRKPYKHELEKAQNFHRIYIDKYKTIGVNPPYR